MLRRILIIILVVVVIIAAIFAIQWFLNRDSETEESTEAPVVVVDEDINTTENDVTIVEGGATGETPITDGTDATSEMPAADGADTSDQPAEGAQATEGYPAADTGTGDTTSADGSAVPAEGTDGATDGNDPNAGGGVPTEAGDAAPAEATEPADDAVAEEPATGTGGIDEVAAVSPGAVFAVQPGVAITHTVKNEEWLTQLARCYGTTVADIQAANNYSCPDLIHPGLVVNIANPGNAGPITINDAPCFNYHTVQQGETLYSIATQYGISYQWLARINAIYNYDYIYAGQQLVIPNPVDAVFTQPPAEPFYYSSCWYEYCPGWQYPPVAVPYTQ